MKILYIVRFNYCDENSKKVKFELIYPVCLYHCTMVTKTENYNQDHCLIMIFNHLHMKESMKDTTRQSRSCKTLDLNFEGMIMTVVGVVGSGLVNRH